MSRKKSSIADEFFNRLAFLMVELGFKNRQQAEFARLIGISASFLNDIINKKKGPSSELFFGIAANFYHVNINWLLTGEGEMFRNVSDIKDEDPEISDLIKMTREILKSNTDYALNLSANIKSFHKSVQLENEVHALKNRVSKIEGKLSAFADKIRKEDPPK